MAYRVLERRAFVQHDVLYFLAALGLFGGEINPRQKGLLLERRKKQKSRERQKRQIFKREEKYQHKRDRQHAAHNPQGYRRRLSGHYQNEQTARYPPAVERVRGQNVNQKHQRACGKHRVGERVRFGEKPPQPRARRADQRVYERTRNRELDFVYRRNPLRVARRRRAVRHEAYFFAHVAHARGAKYMTALMQERGQCVY